MLAVSHGAGGGIEARDLQALAGGPAAARGERGPGGAALAGGGQEGGPGAEDAGHRMARPVAGRGEAGLPVVAGGRSAGARVACRTAAELGAAAVLALSFPLHPAGPTGQDPGRTNCSARACPPSWCRAATTPSASPPSSPTGDAYELVEVPFGDHGFAVPKRAPLTQQDALDGDHRGGRCLARRAALLTPGMPRCGAGHCYGRRKGYADQLWRGSPSHGFDHLPEPQGRR